KCTVQTCAHNNQRYCDLDTIQVDGNAAKQSCETSCGSFVERKGDSYSNTTKEVSPCSDIDCKATDCTYNDACQCHAGEINVEGSNACQCGQTECTTFCCK
ncbi:MAG: DUF1540 domain-containing protein, partial [Lachnospiraceae bacterium]